MALILVAQPDADLRDGLRTTLKSAGHLVETVTTGGDAEHALAATSHDVVIADLSLPDGPGLPFMERFERKGHKTIVFVPQGERLLIELRDDSYFCRPYSRKVLLQIIEHSIETSRSRAKKKLGLAAPLRPQCSPSSVRPAKPGIHRVGVRADPPGCRDDRGESASSRS